MGKNVIRILLLGKTGVGKSSFINYFLGMDVAEAGAGKPCTQILTKYTFNEWDNCTIELYDSKGLEVKDADNWTHNILMELEDSSKRDFTDRYHTIFYCISAQKKIEDYEKKTLKELQQAAKQPIHIILTHCDDTDEATLCEREEYLKKQVSDTIAVYRITSVDKTKRDGTSIKKGGREAVLDGVFDLLWQNVAESIAYKAAHEFSVRYHNELNALKRYTDNFIEENGGFFKSLFRYGNNEQKMNDQIDAISAALEDIPDDVLYVMRDEIKSYVMSLEEVYNAYTQISKNVKKINGQDIYSSCMTEMSLRLNGICSDLVACYLVFMRMGMQSKRDSTNSINEIFRDLSKNINETDIKKSVFEKLIGIGE